MASVTLRPNAAGNYQQWSTFGSPPSHHAGTSDESDTTGVATNSTSDKETEALEDSSLEGVINSVTAYMRAKHYAGSGDETARILWRTHSTDYESGDKSMTASFVDYSEERTVNPSSSSAWTWAEVNALEIGARATAVGAVEAVQVSEFWVVVDYTPPVEKSVSDSGSGAESLGIEKEIPKEVTDSGSGSEAVSLSKTFLKSVSDSGSGADAVSTEEVEPPPLSEPTYGQRTRVVEVVRVGVTDLEIDYPGVLKVRLIDRSGIYEAGPLKNLAAARAWAKRAQVGIVKNPQMAKLYPSAPKSTSVKGVNAYNAMQAAVLIPDALADLYDRMRGKRLSGVNIDVWDQISGAYLGARNTDRNGTLVLPTDAAFVEVVQWKIAGGGYSDAFNGERAAGTPGLEFYFPCNEGSGNLISGFAGVSGQESNLPSGWRWYDSGYFNRPAVKSSGSVSNYVEFVGAEPQGKRSFQFLYYCDDPTDDYRIFEYGIAVGGTPTTGVFSVSVDSGKLKVYAGATSSAGATSLEAGKWYLIQANTSAVMIGIENLQPVYALQIDAYLGGTLDATASQSDTSYAGIGNGVRFIGNEDDGFDEIRHLHRELFAEEITNYAVFLKAGRVPKKSAGKLGEPGW